MVGEVVLGDVLIAKAAVLETDVVDDVLAEHPAVTCLQSVLYTLGVGSLGRKGPLTHSSVGGYRAVEVVTKG